MSSSLSNFCRLIKSRTVENQSAFKVLYESENFGVAFGLLRIELDSLIRLAYLADVGINNTVANLLIDSTLNGDRWMQTTSKGKRALVTDKQMVLVASRLGGWVQLVYNVGCKLIHLSNFHDYKNDDPIMSFSVDDQNDILEYIQTFHGYEEGILNIEIIIMFLPNIFDKIVNNTLSYLSDLESAL